jgi:hypothetical protein
MMLLIVELIVEQNVTSNNVSHSVSSLLHVNCFVSGSLAWPLQSSYSAQYAAVRG